LLGIRRDALEAYVRDSKPLCEAWELAGKYLERKFLGTLPVLGPVAAPRLRAAE
jgi:hypothetical protein